jgi:hypothetical protein
LLIELNFSNLFIASNLGTRSTFRSKEEREFFDCLKKKGKKKIGKKRNPHFLPSKHATHAPLVALAVALVFLSPLLLYCYYSQSKTLSPRFVANVATHSQ